MQSLNSAPCITGLCMLFNYFNVTTDFISNCLVVLFQSCYLPYSFTTLGLKQIEYIFYFCFFNVIGWNCYICVVTSINNTFFFKYIRLQYPIVIGNHYHLNFNIFIFYCSGCNILTIYDIGIQKVKFSFINKYYTGQV